MALRWALAGAALLAAAPMAGGAAPRAPDPEASAARAANQACLATRPAGSVCAGKAEQACVARQQFSSSATIEMCALRERDAWAALMPAAVAEAKSGLDDARLSARLDSAQAAWTHWRDGELALTRALTAGGTIQDTAVARRASELTEARIIDLQGGFLGVEPVEP